MHQGRLALSDFGGVKREGQQSLSRHSLLGTAGFAPPDQLLKLERAHKSWDVYALAVTLFWCLSARYNLESGQYEGRVPATNLLLTPPLTAEGLRLYQLRLSSQGASAEAEALRKLDIGRLVKLEEMRPLTEGDVEALRAALAAQLEGEVQDAAGLAADLVELLAPELEEALQPDLRLRGGTAARLKSACEVALKRVRAEQQRKKDAASRAAPPPIGDSVVIRGEGPPPEPAAALAVIV